MAGPDEGVQPAILAEDADLPIGQIDEQQTTLCVLRQIGDDPQVAAQRRQGTAVEAMPPLPRRSEWCRPWRRSGRG
jgi:hypothetical protein